MSSTTPYGVTAYLGLRCVRCAQLFERLVTAWLDEPARRYATASLNGLHGPSPDNLSCRFRLEYRGLLCERIDAFSRLCSGLIDNNEFRESGHKENSRFLELFIAYAGE